MSGSFFSLNQKYNNLKNQANTITAGGGGGGGSQTLAQVLTVGNNAGGLNMAGVGSITATTVAGTNYSGTNLNLNATKIAIGNLAGQTGQSTTGVAAGDQAGQISQNVGTVAIGYQAGQYNQSFNLNPVILDGFAVAIGYQAGQGSATAGDQQSRGCIAIGRNAGSIKQGYAGGATDPSVYGDAVALGQYAGYNNQGGKCMAIGSYSGGENQGDFAVAIGDEAGITDQGIRAVAIGYNAGRLYQGAGAVAIGYQAGKGVSATAFQGENSIAIGNSTGTTSLGARSIVINASGTDLSPITADACFINPVRAVLNTSSLRFATYNSTTKELSQSNYFNSVNTSSITISTTLLTPLSSIFFVSTGSAITITLPSVSASSPSSVGAEVTFRRRISSSNGAVSFDATGGSLLVPHNSTTGSATIVGISATEHTTTFFCDGVNWYQTYVG